MTRPQGPEPTRSARVSQTAPESESMSATIWRHMQRQPGFNERLRAAERELEQGGGARYEVRDGALRKVRHRS